MVQKYNVQLVSYASFVVICGDALFATSRIAANQTIVAKHAPIVSLAVLAGPAPAASAGMAAIGLHAPLAAFAAITDAAAAMSVGDVLSVTAKVQPIAAGTVDTAITVANALE